MAFIPEADLSQLAARTRVDHQVKKLSGRVMFQLLLLSLLEGGKASLRVMEELLAVGQQPEGTTLTVLSDAWVSFREKPGSYLEKPLRLVKATLESGEQICFVTNIAWLDAYQVAAIYRERWQIEVLIKFLKQHLQLEHLLTRDVNGIQVMRYMTLIVALLLIVYRKLNKLDSDRRARLRFAQELDVEIVRQIVLLCGGDPAKMEKFVT
ncbi:transposase [Pontibacter sp. HSC-14F20]|uniref:transposase n=1 Tax=Pontibacter sp. HSC-14F20 TaxID=2864136 RepID=UPI001C739D37|nr:transposase [Pontibacter sp. HSC-14F20]MBX0331777.1 transposase [Pontibacter sp. HSC-14F20]MBX0332712.1 transposase [Pontibacter sp. HSC-14F20]